MEGSLYTEGHKAAVNFESGLLDRIALILRRRRRAAFTWIAQARRTNFGFYKIERLDGNVGYLDFRMFWEAVQRDA